MLLVHVFIIVLQSRLLSVIITNKYFVFVYLPGSLPEDEMSHKALAPQISIDSGMVQSPPQSAHSEQ